MHDQTVLLTDYAWPDDSVERHIIESVRMNLATGPATPASATEIERLAREHNPVAIMTNWAEVSAAAISASPQLKIVARLGVGLDNIAVDEATKRGIWVTNVPDYCIEEVSDHAVGFALSWTRGIVFFDREVHAGRWVPASAKLRRLAALTCGIIGFGRIGRATARKLAAFGCRLLVYDPVQTSAPTGAELVELHAAAERCPLRNASMTAAVSTTPPRLTLMTIPPGRLDVLESEPEVPPELRAQSGAMLTPHVAFSSDASLLDLRKRAAEEVVRVLSGELPRYPCNKPIMK
jgi:D-3-phosphoglycerate dehydrogenase